MFRQLSKSKSIKSTATEQKEVQATNTITWENVAFAIHLYNRSKNPLRPTTDGFKSLNNFYKANSSKTDELNSAELCTLIRILSWEPSREVLNTLSGNIYSGRKTVYSPLTGATKTAFEYLQNKFSKKVWSSLFTLSRWDILSQTNVMQFLKNADYIEELTNAMLATARYAADDFKLRQLLFTAPEKAEEYARGLICLKMLNIGDGVISEKHKENPREFADAVSQLPLAYYLTRDCQCDPFLKNIFNDTQFSAKMNLLHAAFSIIDDCPSLCDDYRRDDDVLYWCADFCSAQYMNFVQIICLNPAIAKPLAEYFAEVNATPLMKVSARELMAFGH